MVDEVPQLSLHAPTDPLRLPNWRNRAAEQLDSANRFASIRQVGCELHAMVEFRRAQRMLGTPAADAILQRCPAGLRSAYAIRYGHPRISAALEAFVLANVPSQHIADLLGLQPAGVDWYEKAHFDVRDRLAFSGYILFEVIERARWQYPRDWSQHGWKLVAYQVGEAALIEVIGLAKLTDRTQLSPAVRVGTLHLLEDKLREAAQTLREPDPLSIARTLQTLRAEAAKDDVFRPNSYEANVAEVLSEIKWSAGRRYPDFPGFDEFQDCPAELNADEVARVARGETLENAEEIKARKLPPPRSARREDH